MHLPCPLRNDPLHNAVTSMLQNIPAYDRIIYQPIRRKPLVLAMGMNAGTLLFGNCWTNVHL
jgi:hypothetical protein